MTAENWDENWDTLIDDAVALRHALHRRPELPWSERETAETIRAQLTALGIQWRADTGTVATARQTDEAGRSWIDFYAGAGVLNFGHNNECMKDALIEFIRNDGPAHSLDLYTVPKRDFLKKFSQTILEPRGMDHRMQFMGPTGTNAVEAVLKLIPPLTIPDEDLAEGLQILSDAITQTVEAKA